MLSVKTYVDFGYFRAYVNTQKLIVSTCMDANMMPLYSALLGAALLSFAAAPLAAAEAATATVSGERRVSVPVTAAEPWSWAPIRDDASLDAYLARPNHADPAGVAFVEFAPAGPARQLTFAKKG